MYNDRCSVDTCRDKLLFESDRYIVNGKPYCYMCAIAKGCVCPKC